MRYRGGPCRSSGKICSLFPRARGRVLGHERRTVLRERGGCVDVSQAGPDRAWFLKVIPAGQPNAVGEASRMRWVRRCLPVPHVVATGAMRSGGSWLLTSALPGIDATRVRCARERLAVSLARGLYRFHEAPVDDCPFLFRLDEALALAEARSWKRSKRPGTGSDTLDTFATQLSRFQPQISSTMGTTASW